MVPEIKLLPNLDNLLKSITTACLEGMAKTKSQEQQASIDYIENKEQVFTKLLRDYKEKKVIDVEQVFFYLEQLLQATYDFHKRASKQDFGVVVQPKKLPKTVVTIDQLVIEEGKTTVASANVTLKARQKDSRGLVFFKRTKPDVAQLEIVAAEFYRYVLGSSCTSHGKTVVEGSSIKGMYVEAIPGFISMRQLSDLAQDPDPYKKISERISELRKVIESLERSIEEIKEGPVGEEPEKAKALQTQLQEKKNLLGSYTEIERLQLIDTERKSVNIEAISNIMSKALCSAFYFQDWDRHKDNFGISYKDGKLGVASLDYDKSLSGIFGQDKKCYDWSINPQRLRDFPDFKCWYWPTSSNTFRGVFAKKFTPEKVPKMYSEDEARRYSSLKKNEEFQKQTQIEWLKLIFIPQDLRERAVSTLASSVCDKRLGKTPAILEARRLELLNAALQLNSFRELLEEKDIWTTLKEDLKKNLTKEEFEIVTKNWTAIELKIRVGAAKIRALEEQVRVSKPRHALLLEAIKKSGISFSLNVTKENLEETLRKIDASKSPGDICAILKKDLGLDISVEDASKIAQEKYIYMVAKEVPGLVDPLIKKLSEGTLKIHGNFFGNPATKIQNFEKALLAYRKNTDDETAPAKLQNAIVCLRKLGISASVISDKELKEKLSSKPEIETPTFNGSPHMF